MLEELLIHGSVHAYNRVQARPTTSRTPHLVKADMLCLRYMDTLRMSVCLSIPSQLQQRNRDHLIDSAVPHSRLRAPSLPQCDLQSPSVVDPGGLCYAARVPRSCCQNEASNNHLAGSLVVLSSPEPLLVSHNRTSRKASSIRHEARSKKHHIFCFS
jgi:hypothetical protein